MSAKSVTADVSQRLRPLSKQEIDRRIERVLADLSAALEIVATDDGGESGDPLRPRRIPSGALTSRMRKLLADN